MQDLTPNSRDPEFLTPNSTPDSQDVTANSDPEFMIQKSVKRRQMP